MTLRLLAWLPFVLIAWAPVLAPLAGIPLLPASTLSSHAASLATRWPLLLATLALAASAALASALLGSLAAIALHRRTAWWARLPLSAALAAAVVPVYLYALAWFPVLSPSAGRIHGLGGWVASAFVIAAASLPVSFLICSIHLEHLPASLLSAATLYAPAGDVRRRILSPLLRPAFSAAAALVFLTSLTDFSAASLFSADPWALAVFAGFSAHHSPALAALHSLPLLAAGIPAVLLLTRWIRSIEPRRSSSNTPPDSPPGHTTPSLAALALLILSILFLAASLLSQALTGAAAPTPIRIEETSLSLLYSSAGALLALLAAIPVSLHLARRPSSAAWLIAALPLAFPAPLAGIGLISIWNTPFTAPVYSSPAMIALASAARFAPLAALLCAAFRMTINTRLFEAAALYARPSSAWLRVHLRLLSPGWAAAFLLCFALSLSEVAATLPVAPPGATPIAIRLYNYLHYGASASVASLALLLGSAAALCGLLVHLSLRRRSTR